MSDMLHCNGNCYIQYLSHKCITCAQQITNISTYILTSTAEIIYVTLKMSTCFVHFKIRLRMYFRLRAINLHWKQCRS